LAKRTSVHLDAIRGVSALAVLLHHLRGLFFVDYPFLANKSFFLTVLYAVTGYGHQAVIIFFVLSGYFIGTSVMQSVRAQKWSWRTYLVSRITRLQLVLFPALVLGGLWDRIGMRIPQAAPLYFDALYKFNVASVALRSTVPVFLGNFFYLQSIVSPVFGSNGPLWSLSYEFWYYIIFPALILATAAWTANRIRIFYAGLALFLLWFVGAQICFYFLVWIAGSVLGFLPRVIRGWDCLHWRTCMVPHTSVFLGPVDGLRRRILFRPLAVHIASCVARGCFFGLSIWGQEAGRIFLHALRDSFPCLAPFARIAQSSGELAA